MRLLIVPTTIMCFAHDLSPRYREFPWVKEVEVTDSMLFTKREKLRFVQCGQPRFCAASFGRVWIPLISRRLSGIRFFECFGSSEFVVTVICRLRHAERSVDKGTTSKGTRLVAAHARMEITRLREPTKKKKKTKRRKEPRETKLNAFHESQEEL